MKVNHNETESSELLTTSPANPTGDLLQQLQAEIDKLKEIDVAGIEPLLPPTWKEGRSR